MRPRSAGVVEAGGVFQNNYILLKSVGSLQSYPRIDLNGEGAVATFNSVIVTPTGSHVDSGSAIHLNAPHTRGEIISRTLTTGGTIINRGFIGASATPVKGHLECKGLIVGGGRVHAIPELDSCRDGVELSPRSRRGQIAQEEIEYLMARGLDEDEATSTIVRGFLNVDIMGLPAPPEEGHGRTDQQAQRRRRHVTPRCDHPLVYGAVRVCGRPGLHGAAIPSGARSCPPAMPCGPPPADLEALVSAAGRAACPSPGRTRAACGHGSCGAAAGDAPQARRAAAPRPPPFPSPHAGRACRDRLRKGLTMTRPSGYSSLPFAGL